MSLHLTSLTDPRLAELLRHGAIGILPTDTVYGLVASAHHKEAIGRLYTLKSRERQPGTTIGASIEQLRILGFPEDALTRANHYWPNALSVEMKAASIPEYLKRGQSHMAARIPNHPDLLELLAHTGPLMTTSANTPKAPTSRSITEAVAYFGDDVDFYVDAGDLGERPPSTIIGFDENDAVIVYRQGAVDIG
jgi:L-threonylcarbamoyladenylate synthase